jgi:hypothetical protein
MELEIFDTVVNLLPVTDGYELFWGDGVANEWRETYPTLALALTRVAVLAHCGANDWEIGFFSGVNEFTANASSFIRNEVR